MGNDSTFIVISSIQMAVILPINLIGNVLVCVVLITTSELRTPMNYLLVNLAVADIVVAVFMSTDLLFIYGVSHPPGNTGDYLCKFLTGKVLSWVGSVASVFTLVAVAFERYYAIVHPLRHRATIKKKVLYVIITACWVFAFSFNIPLLIVRAYNDNPRVTGYSCKSAWPSTSLAKVYNFVWLVIIGVLPVVAMGILYGHIAKSLWRTNTVLDKVNTSRVRLKSKKRVTKMLIFITVFYALCWMPNLLVNVIVYYHPHSSLVSYGYFITEVLVLVNSSINPFVYSIQSQQFWKGIKSIICCKRRQTSRRIHAAYCTATSIQQSGLTIRRVTVTTL